MKEAIISVNHFRKSYGTNVAVDDISFDVQSGRDLWLARTKRFRQDQHAGKSGRTSKPGWRQP